MTKGDLVEYVFGEKHPCIDYAIPQQVFDKLDSWGVDTFWFVWDYRENKIGGKLLSLSEMFYDKVKSIYDV